MADIRIEVTKIGDEVEKIIENRRNHEYYGATVVLYSLIENLLKFLLCRKICWDLCEGETTILSPKYNRYYPLYFYARIKRYLKYVFNKIFRKSQSATLDLEFDKIAAKIQGYRFYVTINEAKKFELIDTNLANRIHELRKMRNAVIHDAYIFDKRNDPVVMGNILLKAYSVTVELISIFERLMDEIGVDMPEVFETLPIRKQKRP